MSAKRTGLGRNLSALLKQADESLKEVSTDMVNAAQTLKIIPIDELRPGAYQPRGSMDADALEALASSIKQQGILQPIVVRKQQDAPQYEIVAGERRWRASKLAELTEVPVIVRDVNDETAMALALVENLQREALNVMDEARAMYRLNQEFALTHQEIADLLSKSRAAVSNCLRLLQLSAPVALLLESGLLDMGHARCLLQLEADEQRQVADLIVKKGMSVRETEAYVARLKQTKPSERISDPAESNPLFDDALRYLSTYLGTKVQVKATRAGRGRLWIDFKNPKHLSVLLKRLNAAPMEVLD